MNGSESTMVESARGPQWLLPLSLAVALALFAALLLHVESQWGLLALLAGTAALVGGTLRSGRFDRRRAQRVLAAHTRLTRTLAALALIGIALVFREEHFALLMLTTLLIYTVACLGLNIQTGYAGVVNFAGAAFFGVGCYTAALLARHSGLPHLLILPLGGVMAALIGSLLLLPVLRTRGHYAALVTIAFGILFRSFLEVNETLGGPQGLKIPPMRVLGWDFNQNIEIGGMSLSFYLNYLVVAALLAAFAYTLTRRLERSWIGLALDAVRIDETAAASFGIDIRRWKVEAFVIGNFLIGTAGALYAMMTGFVAPTNFTFGDSLILVSIIVLGGIGNPWAIVPAAAIVLILPEKLQSIQEYRFMLYALVVLLILLFRPDGLFPRRLRAMFPHAEREGSA